MERGDVARMFNVAEADVAEFGVLVLLKPDGVQRVATADGVFGVTDHPSNRQLRKWPGGALPVVDGEDGTPGEPAEAGAEKEPLPSPVVEETTAAEKNLVPDGSAETVLSWVDGDPRRAERAKVAELEREKPRSTVLAQLEKVAAP